MQNLYIHIHTSYFLSKRTAYFALASSETVSLYLPLALLAAKTLLPFLLAILALKPCLFTLFLLEG